MEKEYQYAKRIAMTVIPETEWSGLALIKHYPCAKKG